MEIFMENEELIAMADEARLKAYAPYSKFLVGAALLCKNGKVYTGCNIENAAFTPGICAERTAISKAVSEGDMEFEKIAIIGSKDICYPCGVCRQVMVEFCDPKEFEVICADVNKNYKSLKLKDLLPYSFSLEDEWRAGMP